MNRLSQWNQAPTTPGIVVSVFGYIILLGGMVIYLWEARMWLRYGVRSSFSISDLWMLLAGYPLPSTNWVGAQQIVDWVLDSSVSTALNICGALIVWGGVIMKNEAARDAARQRQ